jgi:DNA processing protein
MRLGLFVSGDPQLLNTRSWPSSAAQSTPYGRELAEAFARHLSVCGLTITSGLAAGIDAASHRGPRQ